MSQLIEAAGVDVEAIWPSIFAKALDGKNVSEMLSAVGSASAVAAPAPQAAAGGAAAAAGGDKKEDKKKKEEEKEESDDDMGFGLFD